MKQEVLLGDCLEVMKSIEDKSIDMILCDLPFGTTQAQWDVSIDLKLLWQAYERIIKTNGVIVLFAQTPFDKILGCSNLKWLRYEWIWEKTTATGFFNAKKMPMKAHENILVFYDKLPIFNPQKTTGHSHVHSFTKKIDVQNRTEVYGKSNTEIIGGGATDRYPRSVQVFSTDKQKTRLEGVKHSTQKPVALLEYLINTYTNIGDLVLDNCAGSGSTLVAAQNLNRQFIGIEIEQKFIDIINKRLGRLI